MKSSLRILAGAAAAAITAAGVLFGTAFATASAASKPGVPASVTAALAKAQKLPRAVAPGPAFDAKKAKGKTVWVVGVSTTVPILELQNQLMQSALALVGVKQLVASTDGSPGSWVTAINAAIAHNAAAIVLEGTNPSLIKPQLQKAQAAKIPVIYDFANPGPVSKVAPFTNATVSLPFPQGGVTMADEAIAETGGHANIELIGLNTQPQNSVYQNAIERELKLKCPACKIAGYLNAPIADWSSTMTSEIVNLLHRNPSINVLMAYYDGLVQFVVPGVTQAGDSGHVTVVTHDGTPSILDNISSGNVVVGDVGISNAWQAWATADQTLRLLTGTKPVANEGIPGRLWTKSDIANSQGTNAGYGSAFMTMYKKLWRVS